MSQEIVRMIQISIGSDAVYGLDREGQVYEYQFSTHNWWPLSMQVDPEAQF